MAKKLKKYLLSFFVIISSIIYVSRQQGGQKFNITTGNSTSSGPTDQILNSSVNSSAIQKYKDGVYTGKVADAYYGNIQVQATIQNSRITDVQFLSYPNDRRNSIAINQDSMPILKQEAIQAQSAQVNIVSGATDTSQAFMQSLNSALSQAL